MRRSADFEATVRRGVRAGRTTLVVHCLSVPDRRGTRVGMVVARGVGGAVVRNKVRRRLRGVVIEQRSALPDGADVVVRALAPAAAASYSSLSADFGSALAVAATRSRGNGPGGVGPRWSWCWPALVGGTPMSAVTAGGAAGWSGGLSNARATRAARILAAVGRAIVRTPSRVLLGLLWVYQRLVSPLTPPTCRYYPSCSQYAVIAVRRHGAVRGTWLAVRRLARCHPWAAGGVDDVPVAGAFERRTHEMAGCVPSGSAHSEGAGGDTYGGGGRAPGAPVLEASARAGGSERARSSRR